jgi:hypothetical protein
MISYRSRGARVAARIAAGVAAAAALAGCGAAIAPTSTSTTSTTTQAGSQFNPQLVSTTSGAVPATTTAAAPTGHRRHHKAKHGSTRAPHRSGHPQAPAHHAPAAHPAATPAPRPAPAPAASPSGGATRTITITHTVTVYRSTTAPAPRGNGPWAGSALPALHYTRFSLGGGNVGCALSASHARCDIAVSMWSPPSRPRSCNMAWGQGIAVGGGTGHFVCAGDSVLDPGGPVVANGRDDSVGSVTCEVRSIGVTCFNGAGHGFYLSRTGYATF